MRASGGRYSGTFRNRSSFHSLIFTTVTFFKAVSEHIFECEPRGTSPKWYGHRPRCALKAGK
uniref:Sushi domain-containing protein n=1 Tax=Anguilla anguilla TaxID=7936 RepID=A0A0E9VNI8_ANGAN